MKESIWLEKASKESMTGISKESGALEKGSIRDPQCRDKRCGSIEPKNWYN
jgi:hypothetical protein